jgi:hypothetical protein
MAKTFNQVALRKPRSAENDAAGRETAKQFAFLQQNKQEQITAEEVLVVPSVLEDITASAPVAETVMTIPPAMPAQSAQAKPMIADNESASAPALTHELSKPSTLLKADTHPPLATEELASTEPVAESIRPNARSTTSPAIVQHIGMSAPSLASTTEYTMPAPDLKNATERQSRLEQVNTVTSTTEDERSELIQARYQIEEPNAASAALPEMPSQYPMSAPTARGASTPKSRLGQMTIYPSTEDSERLALIRARHRTGASMIAEYALSQFLATHSDDEIVRMMQAHGHGLRRAKK